VGGYESRVSKRRGRCRGESGAECSGEKYIRGDGNSDLGAGWGSDNVGDAMISIFLFTVFAGVFREGRIGV